MGVFDDLLRDLLKNVVEGLNLQDVANLRAVNLATLKAVLDVWTEIIPKIIPEYWTYSLPVLHGIAAQDKLWRIVDQDKDLSTIDRLPLSSLDIEVPLDMEEMARQLVSALPNLRSLSCSGTSTYDWVSYASALTSLVIEVDQDTDEGEDGLGEYHDPYGEPRIVALRLQDLQLLRCLECRDGGHQFYPDHTGNNSQYWRLSEDSIIPANVTECLLDIRACSRINGLFLSACLALTALDISLKVAEWDVMPILPAVRTMWVRFMYEPEFELEPTKRVAQVTPGVEELYLLGNSEVRGLQLWPCLGFLNDLVHLELNFCADDLPNDDLPNLHATCPNLYSVELCGEHSPDERQSRAWVSSLRARNLNSLTIHNGNNLLIG